MELHGFLPAFASMASNLVTPPGSWPSACLEGFTVNRTYCRPRQKGVDSSDTLGRADATAGKGVRNKDTPVARVSNATKFEALESWKRAPRCRQARVSNATYREWPAGVRFQIRPSRACSRHRGKVQGVHTMDIRAAGALCDPMKLPPRRAPPEGCAWPDCGQTVATGSSTACVCLAKYDTQIRVIPRNIAKYETA